MQWIIVVVGETMSQTFTGMRVYGPYDTEAAALEVARTKFWGRSHVRQLETL